MLELSSIVMVVPSHHLWLVATILDMQPLTTECLIAKSSLGAVLEVLILSPHVASEYINLSR